MKPHITLLALTLVTLHCAAQIPANPNAINKKGRQGPWTILYDKDWKITSSETEAAFYRLISYKNDKPTGRVKDYFRDGVLQMDALMLQDRPEQIFDGTGYWYNEHAVKTIERKFINGLLVESIYYKRDGTVATESWDEMNGRGLTFWNDGNLNGAREAFIEALYQAELEFGKSDRNYAVTSANLGLVYSDLGELVLAEEFLTLAMEIEAVAIGTNHPDYATTCNNLAALYIDQGNFEKAEGLLIQSREIKLKAFGKNSEDYALTCVNLATIFTALGKYNSADSLLQEAKVIYSVNGTENVGYAWVQEISGGLAQSRGKYRDARDHFDEAVNLYDKLLGTGHPTYARAFAARAKLYKVRGDARALSMLEESRERMEASFGKGHPAYAKATYELALGYKDIDDFEKAAPLYEEAKAIQVNNLNKGFVNLSEKEQQLYYQSVKYFFDDYISFILNFLDKPGTSASLYNLQLATKGFIYRATEKTHKRIVESGDSVLIRKYEALKARRDQLAKTYQLAKSESEKVDVKRLEEEANKLEKEVNVLAGRYSIATENNVVTWQQVRDKLKDDEAAVEIIRAKKYTWGEDTEPAYLAMVITPGIREPKRFVFPRGDQLEERGLSLYRNSIQLQVEDTTSYWLYWGWFESLLGDAKKVYFSPDGAFHQISLATLKNPATGKYLVDQVEVRMVGNTGDLLQASGTSKGGKAMLFGYPDYKADDPMKKVSPAKTQTELQKGTSRYLDLTSGEVVELPGTKVELTTIKQLLEESNIPAQSFMLRDASEDNLKSVRDPVILHIATHGFFLSDAQVTDQAQDADLVANPLLRSGILLAGCEASVHGQSAPINREDGVLTAFEAMNLFLDGTDLVVLSACETGLGEIRNGEGVYGLQRAFRQAGAKSILISLWKVSDEATQLLMTSMYREYLKNGDLPKSFRLAQQAVREKFPAPFYWGAFVLNSG